MKKRLIAFAALAVSCGGAPAEAAVTLSMGGGNSSTNGASGSTLTFSSGALSVQVSAWSVNRFSIGPAWLGRYPDGLGVTNASEGAGTAMNSSSIDNQSGIDFVILLFNQAGELAVCNPDPVSGQPCSRGQCRNCELRYAWRRVCGARRRRFPWRAVSGLTSLGTLIRWPATRHLHTRSC